MTQYKVRGIEASDENVVQAWKVDDLVGMTPAQYPDELTRGIEDGDIEINEYGVTIDGEDYTDDGQYVILNKAGVWSGASAEEFEAGHIAVGGEAEEKK